MTAVRPLRVGLAGAGMVSQYHLRGWQDLGAEVELAAVADPDSVRAASCAERFGIARTYTSVADMLAREPLDAVDLMTPPHLHGEHCIDAAARGVAILCQKPLAPTLEEARCVATNVAGRARLMVHENWRHRPHYRRIHQLIVSGAVGRVRSVRLECRSRGLLTDERGQRPALERQPLLATLPRMMVAEVLVHHLDLLAWMFGPCKLLKAQLQRKVDCIAGESTATLELLACDVPVTLIGDMADPGGQPQLRDRLTVIGESGSLAFSDGSLTLQGRSADRQDFNLEADYDASYASTIRHFVDCLRTDCEFETPPQWHLKILKVCEEAYATPSTGEADD